MKHYRDAHVGASIVLCADAFFFEYYFEVYRLKSIPLIIDEFVNNLPEYYEPLHESSLHVTIRGIS